ncbi:MAG TPA: alpha/beta fold hydrolase [Bryobacteraceae bacterium]|nr:alpha/beta fold hydrolase [Bryobacteraceae bacterium]
MKARLWMLAAFAALASASLYAQTATAIKTASAALPTAIPTFSTADISRTGIFYAGGKYVGEPGKEVMGGSAYVEVWVPREIRHPYPIIYIHGAGQTATDWLQTPDGRPGWAYYFAKEGYVQYMVDSPARGRSPYVPDHDGNLTIRTAPNLEAVFTASARKGDFPRARLHNQWPGTGLMGDPIFDDFAKTQVQFLSGGGPLSQDELSRDAFVALLDMIKTPVIILSHSQGGPVGWLMADARPNQVKAIVTVEPAAPPIKNVNTAKVAYNTGGGGLSWGVTSSPITYDPPIKDPSELKVALEEKSDIPGDVVPCYVQQEPVHKLVNLEKIPVVYLSAEGGYHREFDHCLAKWLNQAGVKTQFVRMEDVGLHGNGHEMMLEKNSDEIAQFIDGWIEKNVPQKDQASLAAPPDSIPTFSTQNIARTGFFYAGGKYVGEPGKEVMDDSMYTEVWVPRQVLHPYPVVFFHGNGQTGAVWRQTPDGRPGWAYYLVDHGYTVYMVDYPARGRSAYVPGVDGKLNIRTALQLENIWTAPATSGGNFPRMHKYTQWPSDSPNKGKMGDPVFDNFAKGQVQFVNDQAELSVPAGVALLDKIGSPVILITHSQGGGIGFNVADQRPKLIAGMVAIEPGGPQIGVVDTAKVEYSRVNPKSWGLTPMPMQYDPPFASPSDIKVHLEPSERPGDEVGCYMQDQPVHKLVSFEGMRILSISAEGTYHRVFDVCIPKWLNQAGAKDDFVRLEDAGIHGNQHEMFLDRNSDQVIQFIDGWLSKNIK